VTGIPSTLGSSNPAAFASVRFAGAKQGLELIQDLK
jgi:hypothetical protein